MSKLKPKLFSVMKTYTWKQFYKDVISGIIVAIIALPLSIALAIASGVSPERGLYTAIIGGFIVSFLGGSRVQIGGPTGAFMVIVLGVIAEYGLDGLILATMIAGVMMMLFGLFKLGSVVKFMPYPIITGFTSGIAVVIFTSQVNDFFGMNISNLPGEVLGKWASYFTHLSSIDLTTTLLGVAAFVIILVWPKINKTIPGTLIAILLTSAAVLIFNLDVPTIGSKYADLSNKFPLPSFPSITFEKIKMLIQPAFVIAFLGAVESLLSAVVSDGMIGSRHRSNMELVAQGTANIASAAFGGIPVTGAIARTVANIKNGGRTPVAGMVHSITLLLIYLLLMPLVKLIPLSALAAILFVVAINMSEYKEFRAMFKAPSSDVIVMLVTFGLTVLIDLVVAIEVGLVLSMVLFMKRMSEVSDVSIKKLDFTEETKLESQMDTQPVLMKKPSIEGVQVYQINGPFFFGAAHKYLDAVSQMDKHIEYLIIIMKHVPSMDATALHYFRSSLKICEQKKIQLILTGTRPAVKSTLEKAGYLDEEHHIILKDNIDLGLAFVQELKSKKETN